MGKTKKSGVYRILNIINGKQYIGSSKDLIDRRRRHFLSLSKGKHVNRYLQNAYDKHGKKSFLFEILLECPEKQLIKKEQVFIDKVAVLKGWRFLYNIVPEAGRVVLVGEKNGMFGKKHTQETKDKMSATKKGHIPWNKGKTGIYTEETLSRMSESHRGEQHGFFGKHHTKETKEKIARGNRGKIVGEETRQKISVAAKKRTGEKNPFFGKKHTRETKEKISKANKGKTGLKGEYHPMYGKSHTEETKKKMSEAGRGKVPWNKGKKMPKKGRENNQ